MARKRSTRRFNLRRVRVAGNLGAGALATQDLVTGPLTAVAGDTYRLVTADLAFAWTDVGAIIDDGMEFGFAHSDYTAAEIEECLEAQTSIDLGDKIAQERANRLVRTIGMIGSGQISAAAQGVVFDGGKRRKIKLNWKIAIGDTLDLWIRNASSVVWTTGSGLSAIGDIWIKQ